jgi:nitrous oxidase accessory protein NosD
VRACRVFAGFNQIGVQVVNAPRAVIEDNLITVVSGSSLAALQGVVIGGSSAPDVQIRGNSITSMRQAIHVGVSHADPTRTGTPDRAGRVIIADNVVQVTVLPAVRGARHGIFVGNVDSLRIEGNRITTVRPGTGSTRKSLAGIRVFGFIGRMALVQQNHLSGFGNGDAGIFFNALNNLADGARSIWRATDNFAEGAQTVVDAGITTFLVNLGNKG